MAGSMFHEFTHCLHEVEDRRRYSEYRDKDSLPDGDQWHTKEERRTISGYVGADTYDPICDNCFHLYDSIVHGKPYYSRIGHCGYRSNTPSRAEEEQRDKLLRYYNAPDFRLAWPDRYVIE
jgi:hypothetical protein